MIDLSNLSYRVRNKVILIVSILLMFFLWHFLFKNTANLVNKTWLLEDKIEEGAEAKDKIQNVENEIGNINNLLQGYIIDSVRNREYILYFISNYCAGNNLLINEFPIVSSDQEGDLFIETNRIIIEGGFKNLLKLLHEIEFKNGVSRPSSVSFVKKHDIKRKKEILTMEIFLQNIRVGK
jgi:hypothetical protein